MNFILPKLKHMKELSNLIKKFYEDDFFSFVLEMDQRVFHFYTENECYAVVFMVEENKFDIFRGEDGLFTLHFLLGANDRSIRTYGLNSISIEPINEESYVNGLQYYLDSFPHYTLDDSPVFYLSNKACQKSSAINEEEAMFIIDVLKRLFIIQNEHKKKKLPKPEFESNEGVCIFEFAGKKFKSTYASLGEYEFFPDINMERFSYTPVSVDYREFEVRPGTLYVGQIYGFNKYETYSSLAPFEIDLTPIILYSMSEDGEIHYYLYSSPNYDKDMILAAMVSRMINEQGICDTVITDNYLLHLLLERIGINDVEVKFDPTNEFISYVTKYMVKSSKTSKDVEEFINMIDETKADVREIFLNNIDNLEEVGNHIFADEYDEETEEEDDFLLEESEYVS